MATRSGGVSNAKVASATSEAAALPCPIACFRWQASSSRWRSKWRVQYALPVTYVISVASSVPRA